MSEIIVKTFADGDFQFWTAVFNRYEGISGVKRYVFRVRTDRLPERRAIEKMIPYDYFVPASKDEVDAWLETHSHYLVTEPT